MNMETNVYLESMKLRTDIETRLILEGFEVSGRIRNSEANVLAFNNSYILVCELYDIMDIE